MPKTILSLSRDQLLLETRGAILRKSGHRVLALNSIDHFAQALQQTDIDLIVLGHTLPGHEREDAYRILRDLGSEAPVIELYATPTAPASHAQFQLAIHDQTFQSELIALVSQVLSDHVN